MNTSHVDSRLVERFLSGDKGAHAEVNTYIEAAFGSWRGKLGAEAADIMSDARYKLFVSLRNGDFRFDSLLKTYISRIVSHTCIDFWRSNRRLSADDPEILNLVADVLSAEEKLEDQQRIRLAHRVFEMSSPECQKLWRMYLSHSMKYREIGVLMGTTAGNVRRRMWACRQAARELLEKIEKRDKRK